MESANEAQTEDRFIVPVLRALGFSYTVHAGLPVAGGRRQPDFALFVDERTRSDADRATGRERYRHAVAVADAKRFGRPLDGRTGGGSLSEDPVAQIIHYVLITGCRWGILTNGRTWRLYAADGDLVEGAAHEADLPALLEAGDVEAFRAFGAAAFAPGPSGESRLDRALVESRAAAVAVGGALERQVFGAHTAPGAGGTFPA